MGHIADLSKGLHAWAGKLARPRARELIRIAGAHTIAPVLDRPVRLDILTRPHVSSSTSYLESGIKGHAPAAEAPAQRCCSDKL